MTKAQHWQATEHRKGKSTC